MPRETKKRKLDPAGSSASASSSTSRDVKKLRKDLEKCNGPALIQPLSDSLDDISPETLQTPKDVLDPLLNADAKPKHCVRCHQIFHEKDNTRKSCVVQCGEWDMTSHVDPEYDCYNLVKFDCCGKMRSEGEVEEPDPDEGLVCYTAEHTVDPTKVKYFFRDGWDKARKEKGVTYGGRNPDVRPCKVMGCGTDKSKQ